MGADRTTAPGAVKLTKARASQGVFCLWHGLDVGGWLDLLWRHPPRMDLKHSVRIATAASLAVSNSGWAGVERLLYGRKVARTELTQPPVFILGHWRSGTTLLHNLLTMDQQFTFPNLYSVLFPRHFLATERVVAPLTGWMIPKTRPMDNMEAHWGIPQEDEFALLLLTRMSPYLMVVDHNDPTRYHRYFELSDLSPAELTRWKHEFLGLLKRLTVRSNRPVVLKSPTHTYRIPLLLDMFPNARFLYIHRHPYAVIPSTFHLRRTMFPENTLSSVDETRCEEETLETYLHCMDRYHQTRELIPAGQLHEMRFEDLERDPVGEMRQVYEKMGFNNWDQAEQRLTAELPKLQSYQKNKYKLDLGLRRWIHSHCQHIFERYNYPSLLEEEAAA